MEDWKEYRLKDFMDFNPKIVLKKNTLAKKITMDLLTPHSRDIDKWVIEPYSGGAKFQNGDTIMARITPCLENGKHAFVSCLEEDEVAYGSTEYFVFRGKPGISDNRFVYYLTHSDLFKSTAIKSMVGSSGRQRAQIDVLEDLVMNLPPIQGQVEIAKFLSSLDDKIEINKRINHNLEDQAQALYKSYFVDFEPFKGGKFVDSELGMIPEGWRVAELGTVTRQNSQKVKDRIDVKVLSPVTTGELVLSEEYFTKQVFSESISKYLVVKPLHFAYNPARVNIGSIGMNMFSFDGCVSPVYVVFECEKGYHHFFDYYRKTESFKDEVLNRAIGGVRQTLSYKDFALIKLVYPPYDIVEKFNCIYAGLLENKNSIKREISKLSELRDTLLPKLLSGELKIDDFTC